MMNEDMELVREYAMHRSETAFETLVSRHVSLVHSAALRQAGDPHLAEEITQTVFIILARKAGSLSPKTILPGWLYRTTRFVASAALKNQRRRERRELEAYMQSTNEAHPEPDSPPLLPLLDEAMAKLRDKDRDALVLRYFQNKSLREVGALLSVDEAAAQKRVGRAVDKLRDIFAKRGITMTTPAMVGSISAHSVQATPAVLAKSVSAMAITKGAAASGSTLTLIKGALKIMAWSKAKTAIAIGVIALLTVGTTTVAIHEIRKPTFNPNDFWATSYPTISSSASPEVVQMMTNMYGHQLDSTFPATPVQGCSIEGLLDQCMEVSGTRYYLDKDLAAGTVNFGHQKDLSGAEWVAAFEKALETGKPQWWEMKNKRMRARQENLVLIRFPEQKAVLVLTKAKAAKYQ